MGNTVSCFVEVGSLNLFHFLGQIEKEIGNRDLTLPIKRLIHVAGVAETTSKPEDFGRKFINSL